jgi:diacylglycerol kinase family enzyme
MGVLCVGRGNDFAYGMGIPSDLEAGCHTLAQNRRRRVDIGLVTGGDYPQGRYFGNGVGIGFDAVVGFEALKLKRLSGFPSYIVAALKTIFLYYQAPEVQVQFDGQNIQLHALMVSVMNGRRMGGGFRMAPEARQDDGLFDLCIAEQVSRGRIFGLIPHFMRGTQASQKEVRTPQASRLTVTAVQGSLPVHADGETICTHGLQLTLELFPKQIEMVCQPMEVLA